LPSHIIFQIWCPYCNAELDVTHQRCNVCSKVVLGKLQLFYVLMNPIIEMNEEFQFIGKTVKNNEKTSINVKSYVESLIKYLHKIKETYTELENIVNVELNNEMSQTSGIPFWELQSNIHQVVDKILKNLARYLSLYKSVLSLNPPLILVKLHESILENIFEETFNQMTAIYYNVEKVANDPEKYINNNKLEIVIALEITDKGKLVLEELYNLYSSQNPNSDSVDQIINLDNLNALIEKMVNDLYELYGEIDEEDSDLLIDSVDTMPLILGPTDDQKRQGNRMKTTGTSIQVLGIGLMILPFILGIPYGIASIVLGLILLQFGSTGRAEGDKISSISFTPRLDTMTHREFEVFTADLFSRMGYRCQLMSGRNDKGVDVLARKGDEIIAIQSKHWTNNVGSPVIRELYGSVPLHNASRGIVITNSYFTTPAFETAKQLNIGLIGRDDLKQLIIANYKVNT
jgi:HJR/Mrr/RecB family endonuclease